MNWIGICVNSNADILSFSFCITVHSLFSHTYDLFTRHHVRLFWTVQFEKLPQKCIQSCAH
jgi:hypothetical protein